MECLTEAQVLARIGGELDSQARDVQDRHVWECSACRMLLALAARDSAQPDHERASATQEPPFHPGDRVGRYLLRGLLGTGGMGLVYEAYDPKLQRNVAVKVVRPRTESSNRALTRMVREAQAMARVHSDYVVDVYEAKAARGHFFIAMQLVRGTTLLQWLRHERPSWRGILERFAEAGRGLADAHAAGIVHRDFKPQNVLIRNSGGPVQALVADFGLSASIGGAALTAVTASQRSVSSSMVTQTGARLGTPAYMAPEQYEGSAVTPKADQFSFCVALYEALWGSRPFRGETLAGLRDDVRAGRIIPPSPTLGTPAWLWPIVRRGLEPDPEQRWPSMLRLLDALRRRSRPISRIVAAAALGITATVALSSAGQALEAQPRCSGGGPKIAQVWNEARRAELTRRFAANESGYASDTGTRFQGALDEYATQWAQGHDEACRRAQTDPEAAALFDRRMACLRTRMQRLDAVVGTMLEAEPLPVDAANAMTESLPRIAFCADPLFLRVGADPDDRPEGLAARERVSVALADAEALWGAGHLDEAHDVAIEAVAMAHRGNSETLQARALLMRGRLEFYDNRRSRARDTLLQALLLARGAHDLRTIVDAESALAAASDPAEALQWATVALADSEPIPNSAQRIHALDAAGVASFFAGDLTQAEGHFRAALATLESRRASRLRRSVTRMHLGHVLVQKGHRDEARAEYEQALALQLEVHGPGNPRLVAAMTTLGDLLLFDGETAQGAALLNEAVELLRARPFSTRSLAEALVSAGDAEIRLGDLQQAQKLLEEAVAQAETLGDDAGQVHADALRFLAYVHHDQERYVVAERLRRRALALEKRRNGPLAPDTAIAEVSLAWTLVEAGQPDEAGRLLDHAVAVFEAAEGRDDMHAWALDTRGALLRRIGDPIAAIADHREALTRVAATAADPQSPRLVEGLLLLAEAQLDAGRSQSALQSLLRVRSILDEVGEDAPPDSAERTRDLMAQVTRDTERRVRP